MLERLKIDGFKSIDSQEFSLKPITILTGINSSGKSTVIQSLLILSSAISNSSVLNTYVKKFTNFNEVRNKYTNARKITFYTEEANGLFSMEYNLFLPNELGLKSDMRITENWDRLIFEKNLFYISANRVGQEDIAEYDEEIKFGTNGKYIFGYFEQNKDKEVYKKLIRYTQHNTLEAQLSYWLKYILDIDLRVETSKITSSSVKVSFSSDGLNDLSPFNLGAGNSYLAKILIIGLSCQKDNIFIVENPEIHLHPKAQARLSDFFVMLGNSGIQVILETHSEHIINKLRYNIYKNNFHSDNAIIYYKQDSRTDFVLLMINENGHFTDDENNIVEFPTGFFDSTLDELLEIM